MFSDDSPHGEHIESAGVSLGPSIAEAFDRDPSCLKLFVTIAVLEVLTHVYIYIQIPNVPVR